MGQWVQSQELLQTLQKDAWEKKLLRLGYAGFLAGQCFLRLFFPVSRALQRVYYGGARKGYIGGTAVKISRLQEAFPEIKGLFNVVYLLSNAAYMPKIALQMVKLKNIPIVHNQNGVFYPGWYAGNWSQRNRMMAHSYHMADYVFHQSEFCRKSATKFLGERQGPSEILFNAVNTDIFSPAEHRLVISNPEMFVFLITGKIHPHQVYRVETAVRGIHYARRQGLQCCLRVAGSVHSSVQVAMTELAKELGMRGMVTFSGPYSQQEAPDLYRAAHAYVMTNHNDCCPNTVLEAMACGLPVVYLKSGGVPELVGDEAGVGIPGEESWGEPFVPSGHAVGDAMLRVAQCRDDLRRKARGIAVEKFDIDQWLSRHTQIFQQLLTC